MMKLRKLGAAAGLVMVLYLGGCASSVATHPPIQDRIDRVLRQLEEENPDSASMDSPASKEGEAG